MRKLLKTLLVAGVVALLSRESVAFGQVVTSYYYTPAPTPTVSYYQPAVAYYAPQPAIVAPAPVYSYYAPAPVYSYYAPAPVYSSYYAPQPVVVAPVRYSFYSAPVVTPSYTTASYYVRPGLFGPRVYGTTTYYGPGAVVAPGYSSYYTPLYYRY